MLYMTAKGTLNKYPEKKISVKGTPYLKFQIEIPAPQGKWPTRVYCTAFNELANEYERKLFTGMLIEVQGTPEASAYLNKTGKAVGTLQVIARKISIISAPAQSVIEQPQSDRLPWRPEQDLPQSNITDEDVPF